MNWKTDLDWDLAIKRNSEALNAIVAALFAMLGIVGAETVSRIPKSLHRAISSVLRPAESAVRRLIVMAARGVVVKVIPSRPMPKGQIISKGNGNRLPAFQIYDTRKYFPELSQRRIKYAKHPPRILFLTPESRLDDLWPRPSPGAAPVSSSDGLVNASRLSRRLQALKAALDDLPRQALRMARWQLRRKASKTPTYTSPLRPGPPPGRRKNPLHEVDEVLANCHWLAWEAEKLDTS